MADARKWKCSIRKALRKQRIARQIYHDLNQGYYHNLHQYSKNKIHCSCCMCAVKSSYKGRHRKNTYPYKGTINYKVSDRRRMDAMDFSCRELAETEGA